MKTYTYSEARQQFAALLDEARRSGRVQIRRRDGQLFVLQPATQERSPLDVPGVAAGLLAGDSAEWLREEREAAGDRLLERASGAPAPTSAGRSKGRKRSSPDEQ